MPTIKKQALEIYMINLIRNIRLHTTLATMFVCMTTGLTQAAFDPVNDDTDIFLANPNVTAQRPNVLLYVDNTANWNTAFDNEKAALVNVVNNLSDQYNVGLMFFPETGGGNDSVDGGYVRFSIRQMTEANKTVLSNMVNNLNRTGDAGNNNTLSLGMLEVHRYFSGGKSRATHGKIKSDYASNATHPATIAGLGQHALPASPTSNSNYNSPIADSCQSNFLIYISNGGANENASSLSTAQTALSALGYNTSSTIALSPNGQQGNWMDEWSRYMANADLNPNVAGMQNLTTYTVEVDPITTGQGPSMTALMKSVALNGKGQYFAVSSGNNGQAIVNALNRIFSEIQAVNSVFASTTLPVSVNVRGTNLNQVYIGVFRPDATKSPRWFGNLKMYKLGFDNSTGTLFLADASTTKAENPETGFINASSASFWTESSSYWGFRTADQNGPGGPSDLPDGDLVEKGGTAQQQRISYAASQAARNIYTCTSSCTEGSSLSATPFSNANTEITAANMQLDSKAVSTLSGFETKTISALSDIKPVKGVTMVDRGYYLSSLSSGASGVPLSSLTTVKTTGLTGLTNGLISQNISSLTHPTSGPSAGRRIVTAVVTAGHGLSTGTTVTISGATQAGYNGTFVITKVDDFKFTYDGGTAAAGATTPATGSPIVSTTSSIVTALAPSHGFNSGVQVTIAGVTPIAYNGNYNVTRIDDNSFSFTTASALPPITGFASGSASGATQTAFATRNVHGYANNSSVTISGADQAGFNNTFTITVTGPNTFTFPVPTPIGQGTGTIIATQGGNTITATTFGAHGITPGKVITIAGAHVADFNGVFTALTVPTASTFTYATASPLPATALDSDAAVFYCGLASCTLPLAVVDNHQINNVSLAGYPTSLNIAGAEDNLNIPSTTYNGTSMLPTRITSSSFTYPRQDTNTPESATGSITMRYSTPLAFVSLPAHGYSNGDQITIAGADQGNYNGTFAVRVLDADNFFYQHSGTGFTTIGPGSGAMTASKRTTTARARTVNHGFVTGNNVTIGGATPAVFNGNFTITKIDDNNFTYTLPSPQGNASGSIAATTGSASGSELINLINWVRGQDNFQDENSNGSLTDVRASIHGDVLHSRPAVINYNRHGNDDDVFVFYGSNDGIFRAIKGGVSQSAVTELEPGQEAWGFIPEEFFPQLQRLRNNEPKISSSNKKPYFADGTITVLAEDNSGPGGVNVPDGKIDITVDNDLNPDKVHLFITMRRGGRFMYALDVSNPNDPKLLWKKSHTDPGFAELGQTWSAPSISRTNANSGKPILLIGAGYDPLVEDVDPAAITAVNPSSITAGAVYARSMGRGFFALDAATGNILWQAGPVGGNPGTGHPYVEVPGMNFSIPSDVVTISDRSGSVKNRAYAGDTGGNVWRIDFADANPVNWMVTRLASISSTSGLPTDNSGLRKFLFPPDVVYSPDGFDAVLLGSGDREHPFDTAVQNRFYMFKDIGIYPGKPLIGTTIYTSTGAIAAASNAPTLRESDLFDATSNCIQAAADCTGSGDETDSATAANALNSADGWYVSLDKGEKVVGNSVTLNNVTFFNTMRV
jgi:Tfp pilus tip-associated adhesin PilY1